MKKTFIKAKWLALPVILLFYTVTFVATKRVEPCDTDCERINLFRQLFMIDRESYVSQVGRCTYVRVNDTLCIGVKDTTGINWNTVADSACSIASNNGLPRQFIIIYKISTFPIDTLLKKQCP
jgi:hypothetical protein